MDAIPTLGQINIYIGILNPEASHYTIIIHLYIGKFSVLVLTQKTGIAIMPLLLSLYLIFMPINLFVQKYKNNL